MRRPFTSLSARIALGVVVTVLLIGGSSFWILQDFYRRQMTESLATSTTAQGELIEQSLRYAMHTRSLDLLAEMVQSLADQQGVEHVMILNKQGVVRFSSDSGERGRVLSPSDATCRICHVRQPALRGRTVTFESQDGRRVFRNVNPILNSETCYGCHTPDNRVNGILIVDYSMAAIDSGLRASALNMWLSAVTLAVAIILVVFVFMRRLVLRRLENLVRAVDSIEEGRTCTSVDSSGTDEISHLGLHLDRMARSLDRSMQDLREREAFLDAVINSAEDGIVVVDDSLRIVASNRAFDALFNSEETPLVDTICSCDQFCQKHDREECSARIAFRTGRSVRRIRCLGGNGDPTRYFEISDSPLRNFPGRPQVLEIWRDITRRREIEARLADSERLASLGLLASGISHEINNPLASITTCLDGLKRRLRDGDGRTMPEELPEYLDLIRGEVGRCRDLTGRLKLLGRKPQQNLQPVDLESVIQDILTLLRYEARKRSIRIDMNLDPGIGPAFADPAQMRQVILNVVLNAIQAHDGPGRIDISTGPGPGGFVQIEVSDTGRGIEPENRRRIFEPFFSARPDGRGTGLGLFITKIIVDQAGGTIQATGRSEGGTRLTIRLPAAKEPEGASI